MIRVCCSYQSTISTEDNQPNICICMLQILERSVKFQDISLQTKLTHQFVNVSLMYNPFRGVMFKSTEKAYSTLVTTKDMLSNLTTFREYNLGDSVDVARSYPLLSYGKKGRDVDTFDELQYTMAMTTDKSAMLPPTEDVFKEHVLRAKFHTLIWCKSHDPNHELFEPICALHSCLGDFKTVGSLYRIF